MINRSEIVFTNTSKLLFYPPPGVGTGISVYLVQNERKILTATQSPLRFHYNAPTINGLEMNYDFNIQTKDDDRILVLQGSSFGYPLMDPPLQVHISLHPDAVIDVRRILQHNPNYFSVEPELASSKFASFEESVAYFHQRFSFKQSCRLLHHNSSYIACVLPTNLGTKVKISVTVGEQSGFADYFISPARNLSLQLSSSSASYGNAEGEVLHINGDYFGLLPQQADVTILSRNNHSMAFNASAPLCTLLPFWTWEPFSGHVNPFIRCDTKRLPVGTYLIKIDVARFRNFNNSITPHFSSRYYNYDSFAMANDVLSFQATCPSGYYGNNGEFCSPCSDVNNYNPVNVQASQAYKNIGTTCPMSNMVIPLPMSGWYVAQEHLSHERCSKESNNRSSCPIAWPCYPHQACTSKYSNNDAMKNSIAKISSEISICAYPYSEYACWTCERSYFRFRFGSLCLPCWMSYIALVMFVCLWTVVCYWIIHHSSTKFNAISFMSSRYNLNIHGETSNEEFLARIIRISSVLDMFQNVGLVMTSSLILTSMNMSFQAYALWISGISYLNISSWLAIECLSGQSIFKNYARKDIVNQEIQTYSATFWIVNILPLAITLLFLSKSIADRFFQRTNVDLYDVVQVKRRLSHSQLVNLTTSRWTYAWNIWTGGLAVTFPLILTINMSAMYCVSFATKLSGDERIIGYLPWLPIGSAEGVCWSTDSAESSWQQLQSKLSIVFIVVYSILVPVVCITIPLYHQLEENGISQSNFVAVHATSIVLLLRKVILVAILIIFARQNSEGLTGSSSGNMNNIFLTILTIVVTNSIMGRLPQGVYSLMQSFNLGKEAPTTVDCFKCPEIPPLSSLQQQLTLISDSCFVGILLLVEMAIMLSKNDHTSSSSAFAAVICITIIAVVLCSTTTITSTAPDRNKLLQRELFAGERTPENLDLSTMSQLRCDLEETSAIKQQESRLFQSEDDASPARKQATGWFFKKREAQSPRKSAPSRFSIHRTKKVDNDKVGNEYEARRATISRFPTWREAAVAGTTPTKGTASPPNHNESNRNSINRLENPVQLAARHPEIPVHSWQKMYQNRAQGRRPPIPSKSTPSQDTPDSGPDVRNTHRPQSGNWMASFIHSPPSRSDGHRDKDKTQEAAREIQAENLTNSFKGRSPTGGRAIQVMPMTLKTVNVLPRPRTANQSSSRRNTNSHASIQLSSMEDATSIRKRNGLRDPTRKTQVQGKMDISDSDSSDCDYSDSEHEMKMSDSNANNDNVATTNFQSNNKIEQPGSAADEQKHKRRQLLSLLNQRWQFRKKQISNAHDDAPAVTENSPNHNSNNQYFYRRSKITTTPSKLLPKKWKQIVVQPLPSSETETNQEMASQRNSVAANYSKNHNTAQINNCAKRSKFWSPALSSKTGNNPSPQQTKHLASGNKTAPTVPPQESSYQSMKHTFHEENPLRRSKSPLSDSSSSPPRNRPLPANNTFHKENPLRRSKSPLSDSSSSPPHTRPQPLPSFVAGRHLKSEKVGTTSWPEMNLSNTKKEPSSVNSFEKPITQDIRNPIRRPKFQLLPQQKSPAWSAPTKETVENPALGNKKLENPHSKQPQPRKDNYSSDDEKVAKEAEEI
jgi:hypothetical protein